MMEKTLTTLALVAAAAVVVAAARSSSSSSSELARVFYLELDLVHVMREQKVQLEDALNHLSEYTRQVDKMYSNENCPEGVCAREVMMEKIVGNPIYSYQLLKRIHVYMKNVEAALRNVDVNSKKFQGGAVRPNK